MNSSENRLSFASMLVTGYVFCTIVTLLSPAVAATGWVSDANVSCIAIDLYDRDGNSLHGLREHLSSPVYRENNWTGEIYIDWDPNHSVGNDPIVVNSFGDNALELTGTSADGDAWVEFTLPAPRPAAKEVFLFVTANNARIGLGCTSYDLGVVTLKFEDPCDEYIKSYKLVLNKNIRNWWSGNVYVKYFYYLDSDFEPEARGIAAIAHAGGLSGLDVVRLIVPSPYCDKGLESIRVTAKHVKCWGIDPSPWSSDVSIRLNGISVFAPYLPHLEFKVTQGPVASLTSLKPASLTLYNHAGNVVYSCESYSGLGKVDKIHKEVIRNNAHYRCWKNMGPIPPGIWRVKELELCGPNDHPYPCYPLEPVNVDLCGRDGSTFRIHGWGESRGCIMTAQGQWDNFVRNFEDTRKVRQALKDRTLNLQVEYPPHALDKRYSNTKSDLNRDGRVELADYALFGRHWLRKDCTLLNNWCDGTDLTGDGDVGASDLQAFLENWLHRPPWR